MIQYAVVAADNERILFVVSIYNYHREVQPMVEFRN